MVKLFEDLITLLFLIFSLHGTAFAPAKPGASGLVGLGLAPACHDILCSVYHRDQTGVRLRGALAAARS